MNAQERLAELDITLPRVPVSAGLYQPSVLSGTLLHISGQVPSVGGKPMMQGKCGAEISAEAAVPAARQCALQALAIAHDRLGSLDRIARVVRVAGYVASATGFTEAPKVVNGASQLLIDVFGEDAGRGARIAIGVAELPFGVPVEIEFLFEVMA